MMDPSKDKVIPKPALVPSKDPSHYISHFLQTLISLGGGGSEGVRSLALSSEYVAKRGSTSDTKANNCLELLDSKATLKNLLSEGKS
jgi:hypothetical protein